MAEELTRSQEEYEDEMVMKYERLRPKYPEACKRVFGTETPDEDAAPTPDEDAAPVEEGDGD